MAAIFEIKEHIVSCLLIFAFIKTSSTYTCDMPRYPQYPDSGHHHYEVEIDNFNKTNSSNTQEYQEEVLPYPLHPYYYYPYYYVPEYEPGVPVVIETTTEKAQAGMSCNIFCWLRRVGLFVVQQLLNDQNMPAT
ncbi:hypothetical protein O0L34_g9258 [Tuta absoluta]|nr:hypothetical protein O0L34_g9258 [Tuta absoluta]